MCFFARTILLTGLLFSSSIVVSGNVLQVAVTTTLESSGIADKLNKAFSDRYDVPVRSVALGSGQALRVAGEGDVDVVFAHAPLLEKEFMDKGHGSVRLPLMHNYFVLLGPAGDPAGVGNSETVVAAFRKIAAGEQRFLSRGDNSGTHHKELGIWREAGVTSQEDGWYIEAGAGMGRALIVADNMRAYTLSDRGTFLAYRDNIALQTLYAGDAVLYNPYHVMIVNPDRHPQVKHDLAKQYVDFITGKPGKAIINSHRVGDEQLFYPGVETTSEPFE